MGLGRHGQRATSVDGHRLRYLRWGSLICHGIQGSPVFTSNLNAGEWGTETHSVVSGFTGVQDILTEVLRLIRQTLDFPSHLPSPSFNLNLCESLVFTSSQTRTSCSPRAPWTSTPASPASLREMNDFQLQLRPAGSEGWQDLTRSTKDPTKILQNTGQHEYLPYVRLSPVFRLIHGQTRLIQNTWRLILTKGEKSGLWFLLW